MNDLTSYTVDYVQKKFLGDNNLTEELLVDVNNFRRILSLELKEKSKENVLSAINVLLKRDGIISAEPNMYINPCTTVNDPQFVNGNQWGLSKINAMSAWDVSTPIESVVVGVLDSGIDASHPDLKNKIYRHPVHNISNTLHRDFIKNEVSGKPILEPIDENGHGTHVSGIIARKVIIVLVALVYQQMLNLFH